VASCCECGDEPSGSGAAELVKIVQSYSDLLKGKEGFLRKTTRM
jgi:hypothetical protein